MEIAVTPEVESALRQQAMLRGMSPDAYASQLVEEAIRTDRSPAQRSTDLNPSQQTGESLSVFLRSWGAELNPQGRVIDTSRDSIYEGRGE